VRPGLGLGPDAVRRGTDLKGPHLVGQEARFAGSRQLDQPLLKQSGEPGDQVSLRDSDLLTARDPVTASPTVIHARHRHGGA